MFLPFFEDTHNFCPHCFWCFSGSTFLENFVGKNPPSSGEGLSSSVKTLMMFLVTGVRGRAKAHGEPIEGWGWEHGPACRRACRLTAEPEGKREAGGSCLPHAGRDCQPARLARGSGPGPSMAGTFLYWRPGSRTESLCMLWGDFWAKGPACASIYHALFMLPQFPLLFILSSSMSWDQRPLLLYPLSTVEGKDHPLWQPFPIISLMPIRKIKTICFKNFEGQAKFEILLFFRICFSYV
jgi:hypothetical protein